MTEGSATSYAIDPPAGARLQHYAAAMVIVGGVFAVGGLALDHLPSPDSLSDAQDAIIVDLPPVEAGALPPAETASSRQAAPPDMTPQTAPPEKSEESEPPKPSTAESQEPAPQAPSPAVVLNKPAPSPPKTEPEAVPQEAHEAGAPQTAPRNDTDADDTATRQASAHQITLWQKALMARLQAARHGLPPHERSSGIVKIAFEIDHNGRLVSEHVAKGSGSRALDAAALALVQRAAPYPSPPHDAGAAALSFVVPISFKH